VELFDTDDPETLGILSDVLVDVQAEQKRRDALAICKWADENKRTDDPRSYKLSHAEWLGARLAANALYHRATIEWDERSAA